MIDYLGWSINIIMEIRTGRHCVFMLHVHLVFITKYRKKVFTNEMLVSMKEYMEKVCSDFETTLVEFNGETNHVHLLINYPPKVSISKLVNSLKGVSSRRLRVDYASEIDKLYWKGVLWSPSYFAGSVGGAPLSILKHYIEQQERPV
jgi:putative transposase